VRGCRGNGYRRIGTDGQTLFKYRLLQLAASIQLTGCQFAAISISLPRDQLPKCVTSDSSVTARSTKKINIIQAIQRHINTPGQLLLWMLLLP
jgi:hypothetical protein